MHALERRVPPMACLFFDTETTGLMRMTTSSGTHKRRTFPDPTTVLDAYDGCRVVSVCWLIVRRGHKIVEQDSYLVRPTDFVVPEDSTRVHGITHERAVSDGCSLTRVLDAFADALKRVDRVVGHNVEFDVRVLQAEFVRAGRDEDARRLVQKKRACTMLMGREFLGVDRFPKLTFLYERLFGKPLAGAHDALADTMACFRCHTRMCPPQERGVFHVHDRCVTLTSEQQAVVYERPDRPAMVVVACAGSGKTLTMLARIQWLLEAGHASDPSEIMLMTFTRDAAHGMRRTLAGLLGHEPDGMRIGTIDGIARSYLSDDCDVAVGALSREFAKELRACPSIVRGTIRYAFVDEVQDIDEVQHDILKTLLDRCDVRVFAVGDDAQNIYGFRGSHVRFMQDLANRPDAVVRYLTVNHRSSPEIVAAANAVTRRMARLMEGRPDMRAVVDADASSTKPIVRYCGPDARRQSDVVIAKIRRLATTSMALRDIAVLCSTNRGLFRLEEELARHRIPCICLDRRTKTKTEDVDGVCLSTIHRAKGLEWRVVMMIDVFEPYSSSASDPTDAETDERRRLFYVGITRAREGLLLTYSAPRFAPCVSRFVAETRSDDVWTFRKLDDEACFASRVCGNGETRANRGPIPLSIALSNADVGTFVFPDWDVSTSSNDETTDDDGFKDLWDVAWLAGFAGLAAASTDVRRVLASHPPLSDDGVAIYKRYAGNLQRDAWGVPWPFPEPKDAIAQRDRLEYRNVARDLEDRARRWGLEDAALVPVHAASDAYPDHFVQRIRVDRFDLWDAVVCMRSVRDHRRRDAFLPPDDYEARRVSVVEPRRTDVDRVQAWARSLVVSGSAVVVRWGHPRGGPVIDDRWCAWAQDGSCWDAYVPIAGDEDDARMRLAASARALLSATDDMIRTSRWCYAVDARRCVLRGRLDISTDVWRSSKGLFLSRLSNATP